jgi:ParB-like chromosome segregation protein Spo0J
MSTPPVENISIPMVPGIVIAETKFVDPTSVVVDQKKNLRHAKWTSEQIAALGQSMADSGQVNAVIVKKEENGTLRTVAGYGRTLGSQWLRTSNTDPTFMLRVAVVESLTDQQEAVINSIENLVVRGMNPSDIAIALKALADSGMKDLEIVTHVGRDWSKPSDREWYLRHMALAGLSKESHTAIQAGTLSVDAALALTDLKPAGQKEVLTVLGVELKSGKPTPVEDSNGRLKSSKITARTVADAVKTITEAEPKFLIVPPPPPEPEPTPDPSGEAGGEAPADGKKGKKATKKATKKSAKKAALSSKGARVKSRALPALVAQLDTIINSKKQTEAARTLAENIKTFVNDNSIPDGSLNIYFSKAFEK